MGLDVTGVSNIVVEGLIDDWNDNDDESRHGFINPDFPHAVPRYWTKFRYLQWRPSRDTQSHGFRAGSYSGYGLFRSTLALYSMGVDTYEGGDEAWETVFENSGAPFWGLINFSDCEGIFRGESVTTILDDFVGHRSNYENFLEAKSPYPAWEKDWFVSRYDGFTRAFELADHKGLVIFH